MPGIYPTIILGIYYFYANSNKNVLTATTIGGNGFTVRTWKISVCITTTSKIAISK